MDEFKQRHQNTKEEKRLIMENATRIAFQEEARRRAENAAKTERLRAIRLAAESD